ncbi:putative late blight resistance protein homolog R1A-3 [Primulina huaijiensis]|uniref:putative late blight resistance protein homolog R1A-3 n=1 Tax=Primulina huaijiensis TaxID=1492673 RepID=UPI003CC750BF
MATYASLLSLGHILDHFLQHPPRQIDVLDKAQIDSLLENLTFLRDFLEDFSLIRGDVIQALEEKIARSAYAAEDIIESRVVDLILGNAEAGSERSGIFSYFNIFLKKVTLPFVYSSSTLFYQDLQKVIEEIISLKEDVMKIKETEGIKIMEQPRKAATASSFVRGASDSKNTMVGFDEDLNQIMETLTGDESNLQILPIVGMGGIGKTTLAKNVFDNPLIVCHFDLQAWVTISQQYSVHEILLGLLKEIGGEEITQKNDDELGLCLHRSLFDRRYFIVMDDMWSIEVWDAMKRFLPDNNNGSRVLVTTRLSNVADNFFSCTPHQLHLLDEDQSWALFCDKVFGKESCCPPELEEVGKTIVRNCGGLPLAIVAISGLLAKSSRTVEYWEHVADDTHAALNKGGDGLCFGILSLSYKHLPVHLKPCFLYMAIFPEDFEIRVSRLVKLWVAEGILKPMSSRSLEQIAEDNLKDLIDRNLIQVHDYGSRNKIKTCTFHDLLRDLCLREAQKEKFFLVNGLDNQSKIIDNKRRLIMQRSSDEKLCRQQVFDARNFASCTRSLICWELESTSIKLPVCFRLLRVLNMDDFYSCEEILQLVNLRYIYFDASSNPNLLNPLESLSLLWNLQTIIIAGTLCGSVTPTNLPAEIWEMPQLRHLKMEQGDFYLPDPPSTNSKNGRRDIIVMKNLQTLCTIRNFRCTDEVVHRMPNLKKLGITYWRFPGGFGWDHYEVYNLSNLRNLESLIFGSYENVLRNLCFPQSLKKLTLENCRVPWEDLTVVGLLPHLEVLNLMDKAVKGREWNPVEGEFPELKSLKIFSTDLVEWTADSSHFPRLEKLILGYLEFLKEIPEGIGEIPTLRSILLVFCSDSVYSSAEKIQEEQLELGNYEFQVRINGADRKKYSVGLLAQSTWKKLLNFH